jgi:hypothetical protein
MRKKSYPTTTELVNHNPSSISHHKINYRKPSQIRLTGAHQMKEEECTEKETGKEAVRTYTKTIPLNPVFLALGLRLRLH